MYLQVLISPTINKIYDEGKDIIANLVNGKFLILFFFLYKEKGSQIYF